MSRGQTFPDAILLPDGRIRVVSCDAQYWIMSNTDCTEVASVIEFEYPRDIMDAMRMDGLTVRSK